MVVLAATPRPRHDTGVHAVAQGLHSHVYRHLSELIVRVFDLVEAEGRSLRVAITELSAKLGTGLSFTVAGVVAILLGAGFVMAALWIGLYQHVGPAWASFAAGFGMLGTGAGMLWWAKKVLK